jgi:hypothetical protein
MKFFKLIIASLSLVGISAIYISCTKETPAIATIKSNLSTSATVQVFDATLKSTRNFIWVNDKPVSGAGLAFGGLYPGTGYAFNVPVGLTTFLIKDTLTTSTQPPLHFTQTLTAGKNYTIFMYDTLTSPKQLIVENKIVIPTDTTARLRFANFLYNTSVIPAVDVYSYRRGGINSTPVFTNVQTDSVTDFIPYASMITDTLYVYATGTKSPLIVKSFVTSLTPSRSYTSVLNGSYRGTKTVTTFVTY